MRQDQQVGVTRITTQLQFSPEYEHALLNFPTSHQSLTHDVEYHIERGLHLLSELEDVSEITHADHFARLVQRTNANCVMQSEYFTHWHIAIKEELLDAIDLLVLVHGEDLLALGLKDISRATLAVLCATASVITPPSQPKATFNALKFRERIARIKRTI